jgi:DNA-3-methyladenine glycosylase II
MVICGKVLMFQVKQTGSKEEPKLDIRIKGDLRNCNVDIKQLIEKMLGTSIDLSDFYKMASEDKKLKRLVEPFKGLKPPRFPTLFESLVNGICCQQLSLTVGITYLNRLTEHFGKKDEKISSYAAFPEPSALSKVDLPSLRTLGFSSQRAHAIIELGQSFYGSPVDFESFEGKDSDDILKELTNLKGVGRWTSEYVLLRGFGFLDIFPGDDIGARNSLKRIFDIEEKTDFKKILELISRWHPFEGLVYFHLLLDGLTRSGLIK